MPGAIISDSPASYALREHVNRFNTKLKTYGETFRDRWISSILEFGTSCISAATQVRPMVSDKLCRNNSKGVIFFKLDGDVHFFIVRLLHSRLKRTFYWCICKQNQWTNHLFSSLPLYTPSCCRIYPDCISFSSSRPEGWLSSFCAWSVRSFKDACSGPPKYMSKTHFFFIWMCPTLCRPACRNFRKLFLFNSIVNLLVGCDKFNRQ